MLYKFKCKAAGDLVMLGPQGDELLRLMGREPAPRGIIETGSLAAALAALEAAVHHSEQAPDPGAEGEGSPAAAAGAAETEAAPAVSLRQRAWPMRELLRRAEAAQEPVVWGV